MTEEKEKPAFDASTAGWAEFITKANELMSDAVHDNDGGWYLYTFNGDGSSSTRLQYRSSGLIRLKVMSEEIYEIAKAIEESSSEEDRQQFAEYLKQVALGNVKITG